MKAKHHTNFLPDRVFSYFQKEWKVLLAVAISGLIYNIGLLAGPWFEGKMTGCLVDILKGADQFSDMLVLVLAVDGMAVDQLQLIAIVIQLFLGKMAAVLASYLLPKLHLLSPQPILFLLNII